MGVPALGELTAEQMDVVARHPAQIATMRVIARMINDLRECESAEDYDEFQRYLFRHYYEVEIRRASVRRTLKRLRQGRQLDAGAPDLGNELPVNDVDSWRMEDLTYGRLVRQLRSVGDALAWRASGFNRAYVLALSRNAGPGPMINKVGLDWELGTVESIYREHGHFVLLHDLTNCLRIADATEFTVDRGALLLEVKKTGRRDPAQMERMQAAVDAVMNGARLPGADDARLVRLRADLTAHLGSLRDAVTLAGERGVIGLLVPGGNRGLTCADLLTMSQNIADDWVGKWERERRRLQRRLRLGTGSHEIVANSGDRAARVPELAPYGVYPLSAKQCAQLICDFLIFEVRMPIDDLLAAGERAGLHARFLRLNQSEVLHPSTGLVQFQRGSVGVTLHGNAIDRLLLEMLDIDSVASGLAEVLSAGDPPSEPVPIFANEDRLWR